MQHPHTSFVVECTDLCKTYTDGKNQTHVLSGVDLTLNQGESLAILGSSGSGKSTLLHLLGALDNATSGKVCVAEQNLSPLNETQRAAFRSQYLGFIYQFHHLLMDFSALENVCMPLLIRGEAPALATKKAEQLLNDVGLAHRISHRPSELSGGERQRVAIARALVTEPKLVLADEPTGNLDKENTERFYALLDRLNQTLNTSFIVVTHDAELAAQIGRVEYLQQGKIAKAGH